jgi:hypothetical protein
MVIVLKGVSGKRRFNTDDRSEALPYVIYVRDDAKPMNLSFCLTKKRGAKTYKLGSVGAGEATYYSEGLTELQNTMQTKGGRPWKQCTRK